MYRKMEERREAIRENVLYEQQVMEMSSGDFKDNDPTNYWEIER